MNATITRYIFTALVILTAMAMFAGCVGTLDGDLLAMAAASHYDKPGMNVGTRLYDYQTCVQIDNTSFDALDACMKARGYDVNG